MSNPRSKATAVAVRGPLAGAVAVYPARLRELGYTPKGVVKQLRMVARLSRWLELEGLTAGEVTEQVLARFLAVNPGLGAGSAPGLLTVLGRTGDAAAAVTEDAPDGVVDELLVRFRRHLLVERGIGTATAERYGYYARQFLADQHDAAGLGALTSADVTRCVQREAARVAVASTQYFICGLRAFLRFCFIEGLVEADLSAAALSITGRRRSSLPKGISPAAAAALLGSCDRRRPVGRRDYAILLVLLRLGLRASEVAGLALEDIDWRAGQVVVHGKAHRQDRLLLPAEVGEAIVGYLQRGRPRTAHRQVFLRSRPPIGPMERNGVSGIVRRACRRAGVAEVGAHRLRHTLACELAGAGAGLPEIGDLLRHRGLTSTAIYARVGVDGLRQLALPWPGGER